MGTRLTVQVAGKAEHEALAQLALDLGGLRDIPSICRRLRGFVEAQVPIAGMFVSSYDPTTQLRTAIYGYAEGDELDCSTLPPMPHTGSPHSRAVETGETIVTQDFQEAMAGKPRVNVGVEADARLPQSSVVVAMKARGRIFGGMEIQSTKPAAFTPDHVATLQLAAHLAALAIETVQALEAREREAREHARRAEALEAGMRERISDLARKNNELEGFSFTAAHDLRAPLRAIINLSEELATREASALTPRGRASIEAIHQSSLKMTQFVEDLLRFARTAKAPLKRELVDLTALARASAETLRRLEPDREADIRIQENLYATADPTLASLLVEKLLQHAWRRSAEAGAVAIEMKARLDSGSIVFSVEDRGPGLTPDAASRLFLPFDRAGLNEEGSGLGLATAQRIVERHGGRIWATATHEGGAAVQFTLPSEGPKSYGRPSTSPGQD